MPRALFQSDKPNVRHQALDVRRHLWSTSAKNFGRFPDVVGSGERLGMDAHLKTGSDISLKTVASVKREKCRKRKVTFDMV